MHWLREAANIGTTNACSTLAARMYGDWPYAREVGHVIEAAGVTMLAGIMEGHDVPPDVLTSVVHWLRKGGHDPAGEAHKKVALEGYKYCHNDGCEVVGQLKDFKVCPQCKHARYCGGACQKQDGTAGGHKTACGSFAAKVIVATPRQREASECMRRHQASALAPVTRSCMSCVTY